MRKKSKPFRLGKYLLAKEVNSLTKKELLALKYRILKKLHAEKKRK